MLFYACSGEISETLFCVVFNVTGGVPLDLSSKERMSTALLLHSGTQYSDSRQQKIESYQLLKTGQYLYLTASSFRKHTLLGKG